MQGDCLERMKEIPDGSVDLTVTSPPYDNLRTYNGNNELWSECVWKAVLADLYRVTKQGGVVVWVVGDATIKGSETGTSFKQALYAINCGFNLHDTMIYQKKTPIPQFKCHRYTASFEYMFIFSKGKPVHGVLINEPCKLTGRVDKNYRGQVNSNGVYVGCDAKIVKKEKIKKNIFVYSQNNGIDRNIKHPAQFPQQLAIDHIVSWSNEGDTVLDPFMGSGTTGVACVNTNRKFIGIELDEDYFRVAKDRIKISAINATSE